MAISRRDFMSFGAGVALLAALPFRFARQANGAPAQRTKGAPLSSPDLYKRSKFVSLVGASFAVRTGAGRTSEVTLMQVSDINTGGNQRKQDLEGCFSLLFKGSLKDAIAQDTVTISNPALGEIVLLLVPTVNKDRSSRYYEAVINRSV